MYFNPLVNAFVSCGGSSPSNPCRKDLDSKLFLCVLAAGWALGRAPSHASHYSSKVGHHYFHFCFTDEKTRFREMKASSRREPDSYQRDAIPLPDRLSFEEGPPAREEGTPISQALGTPVTLRVFQTSFRSMGKSEVDLVALHEL